MATTSVPEPRVSVSDYQKGFLILRIYLKAMAFAFTGGMGRQIGRASCRERV